MRNSPKENVFFLEGGCHACKCCFITVKIFSEFFYFSIFFHMYQDEKKIRYQLICYLEKVFFCLICHKDKLLFFASVNEFYFFWI